MTSITAQSENTFATLADLCCKRAATYKLLGRFFYSELDADFLNTLKSMRLPANSGNEALDDGYRLIARYLAGFWDFSFTESSVDFTRTFVGHGNEGHSAAYPIESVYTSEKHLTMQDSRDDVMRFYREWGLEKSPLMPENEDHITVEFEFLAALAERTAQALQSENEGEAVLLMNAQRDFLDEHVLTWNKSFVQGIRIFSKTDLYQGVGRITEGFLQEDRQFLENVISEEE